MRYTPNVNLPVAEDTDMKDGFPLNVDGPRTDAIDALLNDWGWIGYADQSSSGTGRITTVFSSAWGNGTIQYVNSPGEMSLKAGGVYWVSAQVNGGGSSAYARAWVRDQANTISIRGALVGVTASGGGSAATGILVPTVDVNIGLYQESNAAMNWAGTPQTMLSAFRIGNAP